MPSLLLLQIYDRLLRTITTILIRIRFEKLMMFCVIKLAMRN